MDDDLRAYLENHRAFLRTRRMRLKETLKEIEADIQRTGELLEIAEQLASSEEENLRVRTENEQLQAEVRDLSRELHGDTSGDS